MLKGHVQIELHNHKTGLRDRIEQDNLVTDAISMASNISGVCNQQPNMYITPLVTKGLGGLFLFDNTLTESADNVLFPDNAKLIASADQTLNTSDPLRGSINTLESGAIQNGYMNVWDFATSQGNGIIKSLALTNIKGADEPSKPCRSYSGDVLTIPNYQNVIGIDYELDEMYRIIDSDGAKITRNKFYTAHLPVDYEAGMAISLDNEVIASTSLSVGEKRSVMYDGDIYIIVSTGANSVDMYRINASDDWSTEKLWSMEYPLIGNNPQFTIANGYYYITQTYTTGAFIIKRSLTTGDYTVLNAQGYGEITRYNSLFSVGNGVVYGSFYVQATNTSKPFVLYPDDTFLIFTQYTDTTGTYLGFYGENLEATYLTYSPFGSATKKGFLFNYLGTICNLQTPIEKTATMSMKVKYSLINV